MKVYAIIKIAGKSTRIAGPIPKQFRIIKGKPLFIYTLEKFQQSKNIDFISIVAGADYLDYVKKACEEFSINKAIFFAVGGKTGNDSTINGFKAFSNTFNDKDIVVSHDGVRPLLSVKMVDDVVLAVKEGNDIATPSIDLNGMLLFKNDYSRFIKREDVVELQTPTAIAGKAFKKMVSYFQDLSESEKNNLSGIDTIGFLLGYRIYPTEGSTLNIKITHESDLKLFEFFIGNNCNGESC